MISSLPKKEGWLSKRKGIIKKSWVKRYFSLDGYTLSYKKNVKNKTPNRSYKLDMNCHLEFAGTDAKEKKIYILYRGQKSLLVLRFDGEDTEVTSWLTALKEHISSAILRGRILDEEHPDHDSDREEVSSVGDRNSASGPEFKSLETIENKHLRSLNRLARYSSVGNCFLDVDEIIPLSKSTLKTPLIRRAGTPRGAASNDDAYDWDMYKVENLLRLFKSNRRGRSTMMKSCTSIDLEAEELFYLIMDLSPNRKQWDVTFDQGKIISKTDRHNDIVHIRYKPVYITPIIVHARDICCGRYWRRNEDGTYVVVFVSQTNKLCPPKDNSVRGELVGSGFTITPLAKGIGCQVTQFMDMNLCGWMGACCFPSYYQDYNEHLVKSIAGLAAFVQQRTKEDMMRNSTHNVLLKDPSVMSSKEANEVKEAASLDMILNTSFPHITNQGDYGYWSCADAREFMVRDLNYAVDHCKVASKPSACTLLGMDILQDEVRIDHASSIQGSLAQQAREAGDTRSKLVINIQLPGPPFISVVSVLAIPESLPGSERTLYLLKKFMSGDTEFCNTRFKLIPRIEDGNWIVKNSVGSQPALIGTKLETSYYHGEDYLEVCFDTGVNVVAKGIIKIVKKFASALVVDLAFLIQAELDDELPEQVLSVLRIGNVDLTKAKSVAGLSRKTGEDNLKVESKESISRNSSTQSINETKKNA